MGNKQTRRSISVRGTTYDKLRQYGEAHGRSMSDIVEELLAKILDTELPERPVAPLPLPAPKPKVEKSESRLRFNPPPVMKPRPVLANRVAVRPVPPAPPPRPVASTSQLPGRPAPTPASAVVGTRRVEVADSDDYRAIKF